MTLPPPPKHANCTLPWWLEGGCSTVQLLSTGLQGPTTIRQSNTFMLVPHLLLENRLLFITLDTVLATLNGCRYEPRRQHSCVERVDQQNTDHKSVQIPRDTLYEVCKDKNANITVCMTKWFHVLGIMMTNSYRHPTIMCLPSDKPIHFYESISRVLYTLDDIATTTQNWYNTLLSLSTSSNR